jgi:hypothetical protein
MKNINRLLLHGSETHEIRKSQASREPFSPNPRVLPRHCRCPPPPLPPLPYRSPHLHHHRMNHRPEHPSGYQNLRQCLKHIYFLFGGGWVVYHSGRKTECRNENLPITIMIEASVDVHSSRTPTHLVSFALHHLNYIVHIGYWGDGYQIILNAYLRLRSLVDVRPQNGAKTDPL